MSMDSFFWQYGYPEFVRNPVLVNKRFSAHCYRPQTLASNLAKSPTGQVHSAFSLDPDGILIPFDEIVEAGA